MSLKIFACLLAPQRKKGIITQEEYKRRIKEKVKIE
jgi:hypothetical protein